MHKDSVTVVHQALYGYAEGHRLLQSSMSLNKSTERDLSVLTDLSGSTGGEPFESYVTGCPFSEEGFYALSRTWAAPEMPRPGCVWTHTFFVDLNDLDATVMERLWNSFSVPREVGGYSAYGRPLELWDLARGDGRGRGSMLRRYVEAVAEALYSGGKKPVALVVDSCRQIEAMVLGVWTQQWSSLARGFRFCSGAIQPRRIRGELFDLQCIPRRFYRRSRWKNDVIVIDNVGEERVNTSVWVKYLVDDLCEDGRTELRQFIEIMGRGLGDDRSVFASVVKIFVSGRKWALGGGTVEDVVNAVCTAFPRRDAAKALKVALFGDVVAREGAFMRGVDEREILGAIAGARVLDAELLEVRRRASAAWAGRTRDWELLRKARVLRGASSVARNIVAGIASTMARSELAEARATAGLLEELAEVEPALLGHEEAWRGGADEQVRLFEILVEKTRDERLRASAVGAMWDARSDAVAREAIAATGRRGVWTVLDRIEAGGTGGAASGKGRTKWRRVLRSRQAEVAGWLGRAAGRERVLGRASWRALAEIVDPTDREVARIESRMWLRTLGGADGEPVPHGDEVAVLVLSVGIRGDGAEARALVGRSFDAVHSALLVEGLPEKVWRRLEGVLEDAPWWLRWDRAATLRRTIARQCITKKWSASEFLCLAEKKKNFRLIIGTVKGLEGGENYLMSVWKDAVARADHMVGWKVKELGRWRRSREEAGEDNDVSLL